MFYEITCLLGSFIIITNSLRSNSVIIMNYAVRISLRTSRNSCRVLLHTVLFHCCLYRFLRGFTAARGLLFYNGNWAAVGEYFSVGTNQYSECFTWNILLWVIRNIYLSREDSHRFQVMSNSKFVSVKVQCSAWILVICYKNIVKSAVCIAVYSCKRRRYYNTAILSSSDSWTDVENPGEIPLRGLL